MFGQWGKVTDVFMPKKKNKNGDRFGFVRFEGVKVARVLEELDQLWISSFKLRVNISRFNRGKEVVEKNNDRGVTNIKIDQKNARQTIRGIGRNEISGVRYADVVANRVWKPKEAIGVGDKNGAEWTGIEHSMEEEDMQWLKKCYVGKVYSPDDILMLQDKFILAWVLSVTVRPTGGDMVLIQVAKDEDFVELVKDEIDMFERWFSDLKAWTPKLVPKERYAWIRFQGVSVHAWGEIFSDNWRSS